MAITRTAALIGTIAFAAVIASGAWWTGSQIESPADAAARTAPPEPSPILVPVERRVLSSTIVTRGTGRYGLPQKISVAPSTLKPNPGLIATLPLRNAQLKEGDVILTASGRPVFVLRGQVPAYRDLAPGVSGDDVQQLEQALERLGFSPGSVDGLYDQQTADAVARWYTARKWEPFGPTREQVAALAVLERDLGEANKAKLAAESAAAAAAMSVEAARASAEQSAKVVASELAAKRSNARRLKVDDSATQALKLENAKAVHAESAAEAAVQAQIAERALIVLDPRQPATAREAAEAKLDLARAALELARATAREARVKGEMAIQAAEREARQATEQVELAEGGLRSVDLESRKTVQSAIDAQKLAELEVSLTGERAARLTAELAAARRRIGVQVPVDEIVFVRTFPVRVEEVTATIGGPASGPVLSVTDNQLAVDSSLTLDTAPLVKPGMPVEIDEPDLGVKAKGVIEQVASTPGTRGADGYHVYFEVRVIDAKTKIDGLSLRLTIPTESTKGPVLAVPTSALSLAVDGNSRIQVQVRNELKYVVVRPGLSASGYVEVTPVDARLEAGQLVVVGYKMADKKELP